MLDKNQPALTPSSLSVAHENGLFPWLVWGLAAFFFFAEYFARVAPAVMVPQLMHDFQVDALALGSLSAIFYFAYVSMQLPVGVLMDRFGPRKLLTFNALLCGAGCLLFSIAHQVIIAEAGRLLVGLGAAFAFVGALKLASVWFPPERFGLLAGITQALGMLGAAVGDAPMSVVVAQLGWRMTMVWIGVIFLVLALLIGWLVTDLPQHKGKRSAVQADTDPNSFFFGLKKVLTDARSWKNAVFVGLLYAPTATFAELWGVSYLVNVYGLSEHVAAMGIGLIFIGWAIGGPLTGWFSDRIGRRKPIMLASAGMGCVLFMLILYCPHMPVSLLFLCLLCYGMTNTGVVMAYAVAAEIQPRQWAGTSLAFANMASVIIGAAFQPLVGYFLDLGWDGTVRGGIHVYSAANYHHALLILPCCLAVSVVVGLLVKETYCRNINELQPN